MAKTFDDFFENVVNILGIKEFERDLNIHINSTFTDLIDIAKRNINIILVLPMINKNIPSESRFKLKNVSESDIQQEVLNLISKKPGVLGNISTNILKKVSYNLKNQIAIFNVNFLIS